jgi:hypothetical protein
MISAFLTRRIPMPLLTKLSAVALAAAASLLGANAALAQQAVQRSATYGNITAVSEIVGQTSTATVAAGGSPLYIPGAGQFTGTVGLRMDYGADGAFVCSGSLIGSHHIVTAAHCVSDGTPGRPLSTTVYFYSFNPAEDAPVYAGGASVTQVGVSGYAVHPLYTGEVIDQNDIAVLTMSSAAPAWATPYELSPLSDLTGLDHTITGYGARSSSGGTNGTLSGFGLGTGRLRTAENRFDFRFGDADFNGYFEDNAPPAVDWVWISDFDNGTTAKDGSCNAMVAEGLVGAVFTSSKYCDLGRGSREGIGAGGDSGTGYFVDGKLAAVHSFAAWYNADESANRFGQLKGAVSVDFHRGFITSAVPEPSTWAMLIGGMALVGAAARRGRRQG